MNAGVLLYFTWVTDVWCSGKSLEDKISTTSWSSFSTFSSFENHRKLFQFLILNMLEDYKKKKIDMVVINIFV